MWKACPDKLEEKKSIYCMNNFNFKVSESCPIDKNDCLQHYIGISVKNIY